MAENNNNENLNEVERPTIAELKERATGIKDETNAGANTAKRVGGLMYDMIDVLDANMEQMAGDTLKAPLNAINTAGLGIPDNNKFLAYKNNVWTYVDLSTIVSSVDWDHVTNKPDLNNLPYLANSTPYGAGLSCSDGAIYLKDQNGNVLAYADISSGGGGGGSDAYAVRYIPSGQNAGNVKLPVDSQGDYKKGNLWANSIIIGNADTIYGSIAKSASTNDIIFDNNLNGGIFEFDKSIATTSPKIILGNRSPKKVEISIPSGSGITDKLDINTFTYVTDTGYTQDTGGSIYLNGVAIGSGGGGGGLTAATAGGQNIVATGTTTAAIPVADDTHYGVIKIDSAATLSTNQYPVKLNSNNVAYVEVIGGGGGGITNVKIAGSAASIQDNYALIPKAGVMQYGVIQIGAYRDAVATCESVGSLASTQNYQLQMDSTGKTFVHVPWTSGGGGGIPYIKVGQTDVPTTSGSYITLKAGNNVTLTPDTTDDSITIAATGGTGGGVAAINVGGQPVAGIGDTFSMTGTTGISLTPYTNGVLIGADFSSIWQPNNSSTPNRVVADDLNDDVGTEFLNTDGISSLLSLLRRIAPNMEITASSNDVDKIQFFGIETLTSGSTLANNSYFYLTGYAGGLTNPVIFYNGSIIKLFLYKENSTYYYCGWNGSKPLDGSSVDPTTSTSRDNFTAILEAARQGLIANAGISVSYSSDALYTDSARARSNMPNVRAKVAQRA